MPKWFKKKTCSSCGSEDLWPVEPHPCIVCGKEFCHNCAPENTFLASVRGKDYKFLGEAVTCSKNCLSDFEEKIFEKLSLSDELGTDISYVLPNKNAPPPTKQFTYPSALPEEALAEIQTFMMTYQRLGKVLQRAFTRVLRELNPKLGMAATRNSNYLASGDRWWWEFTRKYVLEANKVIARNLEASGHPLEAAEIYEHIREYDKAKQLREKDKQVIVKDISVNLNALLKQIKDGGIVAVYRCPHCGGKLKVGKTTKIQELRVCEHCNSEIESMELADFLKTVLS